MSYLAEFEQYQYQRNADCTAFRLRWRNVTGKIDAVKSGDGSVTIFYNKFTRLGRRLSADSESERHFIGRAVREYMGADADALTIFEGCSN